jgi:hypothetical protein
MKNHRVTQSSNSGIISCKIEILLSCLSKWGPKMLHNLFRPTSTRLIFLTSKIDFGNRLSLTETIEMQKFVMNVIVRFVA